MPHEPYVLRYCDCLCCRLTFHHCAARTSRTPVLWLSVLPTYIPSLCLMNLTYSGIVVVCIADLPSITVPHEPHVLRYCDCLCCRLTFHRCAASTSRTPVLWLSVLLTYIPSLCRINLAYSGIVVVCIADLHSITVPLEPHVLRYCSCLYCRLTFHRCAASTSRTPVLWLSCIADLHSITVPHEPHVLRYCSCLYCRLTFHHRASRTSRTPVLWLSVLPTYIPSLCCTNLTYSGIVVVCIADLHSITVPHEPRVLRYCSCLYCRLTFPHCAALTSRTPVLWLSVLPTYIPSLCHINLTYSGIVVVCIADLHSITVPHQPYVLRYCGCL